MKFFEHDIDLETSDILSFLKSVLILIVFAPFFMINEISLKIVFQRKEILAKVLLVSFGIAAAFGVFFLFADFLAGNISLLDGRLPLVAVIISAALLFLGYAAFVSVDLPLYTELEHMIAVSARDAGTVKTVNFEPQAAGTADSAQEAVSQELAGSFTETGAAQPTLSNFAEYERNTSQTEGALHPLSPDVGALAGMAVDSVSSADDIARELDAVGDQMLTQNAVRQGGVPESTDIEDLQKLLDAMQQPVHQVSSVPEQPVHQVSPVPEQQLPSAHKFDFEKIRTLWKGINSFDNSELQKIHDAMRSSTKPSRYLDEDFIAEIAKKKIDEDLNFISELNLSVIPSSFTFTA